MIKKNNRVRRYDPISEKPFTVSRSRIQGFLDCPRCFYLQNRLAVKALRSFPFRLNSATDTLLKKTFDEARKKQVPHRYFKEKKIDLVPFQHEKINEWREKKRNIASPMFCHRQVKPPLDGGKFLKLIVKIKLNSVLKLNLSN